MDGHVFLWRLHLDTFFVVAGDRKTYAGLALDRNPVYNFEYKQSRVTDIAVKTDSKTTVYLATEDRQIKEIEAGKEKVRFEGGPLYSQLLGL